MTAPRLGSALRSRFSRPSFVADLILRPTQAFIRTEAASGILLLAATVAAMNWANSPWSDEYFDLWHRELSLDLSWFKLEADLLHAVNDGLMTIFFFMVGLEIKREFVHGELASRERAILPIAAAIGGMVAPALIYAAFNWGEAGGKGWGIPMATDIAFAIGVISLLGRRVPFGLKVFLLALAIADDLGAIGVIAIFYTDDISLAAIGWGAGALAVTFALNRSGVRATHVFILMGFLLWLAIFESGIHATLTGVILALLTPSQSDQSKEGFRVRAREILEQYRRADEREDAEAMDIYAARLERLSRATESPLDRLERLVHPWVSYGVVPIFAFANAGLHIDRDLIDAALDSTVTYGVTFGLLGGKLGGIAVMTFVVVRLGLGRLPQSVSFVHIVGAALLAAIGFTVSLFIGGLAFDDPHLEDQAKAGIFASSLIAAAAGYLLLRFVARPVSSS